MTSRSGAPMGVLITSASRKVSLVRAFQQALRHEGGGVVVAVDVSPLAAALRAADYAYLVPRSGDADFIPALARLIRRHGVRLVIPTRDEELPVLAERQGELREAGAMVMVPPAEVTAACQDKRRFEAFCRTHGFATPRTYDHPEALTERELPVFLRAQFGKGSRFAWRVDAMKHLRAILALLDQPVVQEFVQAPEYTVDLFADFEGTVRSVVPRERVAVLGGESFIARTVRHPLLIEQTMSLARALGLIGHNTVQCFLHEGMVKFIEVNPRYGGGASLGFAAGAPTPRYLVRLVQGKKLEVTVGNFQEGVVDLRYVEDCFVTEKDTDRVARAD